MPCEFTLQKTDGGARAATLSLPHGRVETPCFMPVGTQGTVKALLHCHLEEIGFSLLLCNAYYLYLRPGEKAFPKKSLHQFIHWKHNLLTDSGGYQIFNLSPLFTVEDQGVHCRSPYDGFPFTLTPEKVVQFQEEMGVDIMMVLDHCLPYPSTKKALQDALQRTTLWAERAYACWQQKSALFGIVQGGTEPLLRKKSAQQIAAIPFSGYAIGGLSVGEPKELLFPSLEETLRFLPKEKPRYLMGIGKPEDILKAVKMGVDMFDCILPTRLGRSGTAFTSQGKVSVKNACYQADDAPLDPLCNCYTCQNFSRSYLRHLYKAQEISLMILVTLHNLTFYQKLMRRIRSAICRGTLQRAEVADLIAV